MLSSRHGVALSPRCPVSVSVGGEAHLVPGSSIPEEKKKKRKKKKQGMQRSDCRERERGTDRENKENVVGESKSWVGSDQRRRLMFVSLLRCCRAHAQGSRLGGVTPVVSAPPQAIRSEGLGPPNSGPLWGIQGISGGAAHLILLHAPPRSILHRFSIRWIVLLGRGTLPCCDCRLRSDSQENILEQHLANSSSRQTRPRPIPMHPQPPIRPGRRQELAVVGPFSAASSGKRQAISRLVSGHAGNCKAQHSEAGLENNLPFQPTLRLSME